LWIRAVGDTGVFSNTILEERDQRLAATGSLAAVAIPAENTVIFCTSDGSCPTKLTPGMGRSSLALSAADLEAAHEARQPAIVGDIGTRRSRDEARAARRGASARREEAEREVRVSESVPFKYRAFLSYSHRDKTWGKWLHRALERYPIDKDLVERPTAVGPVPKSLRSIFRDREDFSAGHSLTVRPSSAPLLRCRIEIIPSIVDADN
jgi:hypothetical protein